MGNPTKLEQWAQWAEIVASVAIVVSLVFLVQEVRYNTSILERQAVLDRTAAFNDQFFEDSPLPEILSKVKAVDGPEPLEQAFVERYGLSYEEAVRWVRHLSFVWSALEADYQMNGRSQALEAVASGLLDYPDNQLFWDRGAPQIATGEFRQYVAALRSGR
jgi:hypothetical protein